MTIFVEDVQGEIGVPVRPKEPLPDDERKLIPLELADRR
jgi:hypothetical protein